MEKRIVKNKKVQVMKDLKEIGAVEIIIHPTEVMTSSKITRTIEKHLVKKAIETINTIEDIVAFEDNYGHLVVRYDTRRKDTMVVFDIIESVEEVTVEEVTVEEVVLVKPELIEIYHNGQFIKVWKYSNGGYKKACSKCYGSGVLNHFMHNDNGTCFKCGGTGKGPEVKIKNPIKTDYEIRIDAVERYAKRKFKKTGNLPNVQEVYENWNDRFKDTYKFIEFFKKL